MVSPKIYVEGGGDSKRLRQACRRGFIKFFEKAGLAGRLPKVEVCGSRENTYQDFRDALSKGNRDAMLLVDSEGPVTAPSPWLHLKARDNWDRPANATDDQCHLMVQVMESWFLADREALQTHYGQGFRAPSLPQNPNIEDISKDDVLAGLNRATRDTGKGAYNKSSDSFAILEKLYPAKVRQRSRYADQLILALLD